MTLVAGDVTVLGWPISVDTDPETIIKSAGGDYVEPTADVLLNDGVDYGRPSDPIRGTLRAGYTPSDQSTNILKALCRYAADQIPLTLGATLFAGHRPSGAADTCHVILERGPELVDPEDADLRRKRVQILTRGAPGDYFDARDAAHAVFDLLINAHDVALDGWRINAVTGEAPQSLGQDGRGRFEFSTNLMVYARRIPA